MKRASSYVLTSTLGMAVIALIVNLTMMVGLFISSRADRRSAADFRRENRLTHWLRR